MTVALSSIHGSFRLSRFVGANSPMNGAAHDSIPLTNGDQAHAKPTADIQRDASKLEDDLPVFELSQVSLALLVHRTAGEIFKDLLTLAEMCAS